MTLQQIAELVQGELHSSHPEKTVTGIASLKDATAEDLSIYSLPRYLKELRQTKAAVVLVAPSFKEDVSCDIIRVENPSKAFDKVIAAFAPQDIKPVVGVHPQAVVAPSATLEEGVSIGPCAVVEEGAFVGKGTIVGPLCTVGAYARVGQDCLLYSHVTVRERCILGDRVILQPGVVIGSCGFGYDTQQGIHHKIPQAGIVQIDSDVEVGANTTIDRARFGKTHIGEGTKIDNLVQIAHNVVIGPHSIICAHVGISGSTHLGSYVTLAGQVGLSGHLEVGDRVIIGAQAGVSKNISSDTIFLGSPAKPIKTWKENNFYIHNLGKLFQRVKTLEAELAETKKEGTLSK